MADERTLKLVHAPLTVARLEAFLVYQRALLRELRGAPKADWAGQLAFAHLHALQAAKIDSHQQARLRVVIDEFCGNRWSARVLRERLERAKDAVSAGGAAPKEARVVTEAPKQLAVLEDLTSFEARIGAETLKMLRAHEAELLLLHEQLAKLQGPGHLHPRA